MGYAKFIGVVALVLIPKITLAQPSPLDGLSEEQIQQVEREKGKDRSEIMRIQREHPLPKQFSPDDRRASLEIAKGAAGALEDGLPDYRSSRLRNIKAVLQQSWQSFERDYYICGEINSKTRSGGYGGWHKFYAGRKRGSVEVHLDTGLSGALVLPMICDGTSDGGFVQDRNPAYLKQLAPKP